VSHYKSGAEALIAMHGKWCSNRGNDGDGYKDHGGYGVDANVLRWLFYISGDRGRGGNGRDETCRAINLVIWISDYNSCYCLNVVGKVGD